MTRITAQFEEIIVDTDAWDMQDLGPDVSECLLDRGTRGHIARTLGTTFGPR